MEQTNPAQPEVTVDQRLEAFLGVADEPEQKQAQDGEQPNPEVTADDLAPEDTEQEASGDEWFDLDLEGQVKRVSKEEAKKLAQMGLSSTQRWQAAAELQRSNEEYRTALQAKLQLHPQIIDAAATFKNYATALEQYQNVDWIRLSQEDPIAYSQSRAQFDQLRDGYGTARARLEQAAQAAQHVESTIDQAALAVQSNKVMDALPEWRDPQRRAADQGRIRQYLLSEGISDGEADSLFDARHLIIARKAMLYDQAMRAKSGRQTQPTASLRPGAAPPRSNERQKTQEVIKNLHQAKDPAKKKELFEAALDRKLGRFVR